MLKHLGHPKRLVQLAETDATHRKKKQKVTPSTAKTPYPWGSVRIIQYNYINGTHVASKVSHFRQIAEAIRKMHENGYVHGDIRGFNMLHPHPLPKDGENENGITESRLIDFDFSGKEDEDFYPTGYATIVMDNAKKRAGRAEQPLKKVHDWKDLASVMICYTVDDEDESIKSVTVAQFSKIRKVWEGIAEDFSLGIEDENNALEKFDMFLEEYGDVAIVLTAAKKDQYGALSKGKIFEEFNRFIG